MIKYDFGEEETVWIRLKLLKFGFLLDLLKVKPNSRRDVSWKCCDVGYEPRQCRDVRV